MKTMNFFKTGIVLAIIFFAGTLCVNAQSRPSIAIISIHTSGLTFDQSSISNYVSLELQKKDKFEVFDKYEIAEILKQNDVDATNCFSKSCLTSVGKLLKTNFILSGDVDRLGEKIVVTLRLINVNQESIEKTIVTEYLNEEVYIQKMIALSVNELLGIANDPNLVEQLVNTELPVISDKTSLKLNGPRMGVTYTEGMIGKRMMASEKEGGYDMFPAASMFGYQFEIQYISSGNFQALIEVFPSINGLESGVFVPSMTFMNGFRLNKSGWEIGLGPTIKPVRTAYGYFDENDKWIREQDIPNGEVHELQKQIDSRGQLEASTGMIFAIGKTVRSGYLNIPINFYFSPRKNGTTVGVSVGFNVAKKQYSISD